MSAWNARLISLCSVIDIDCEPEEVAAVLQTTLATFPPSQAPASLNYRIENCETGYQLFRNGTSIAESDKAHLIAVRLEEDVQLQSSEHTDDPYWFLHGAVVVNEFGSVCIVGESGAGKSTLTLALLERGASYFTDEAFGLSLSAPTVSYRRPLCLKRWPEDLPAGFSSAPHQAFAGLPGPERILVSFPSQLLADEAPGLPTFIHLKPEPANGRSVKQLSPGIALNSLWPSTFNLKPQTLGLATEILRAVPVYEQLRMPIGEAVESVYRLQRANQNK